MKVFKYPLRRIDHQVVSMPTGATILSVQLQKCELQIWALVDELLLETDVVDRSFHIVGTGMALPDGVNFNHLSTIQTHDGDFVFHVFEELGTI